MLPIVVALPVAAGLLLRGSWDLWAQTLVHLGSAAGLTAWLLSRAAAGYLPLPSRRNLAWTAGLAALGAASVWGSPLRALALPDWYNFLNALWLFPVLAAVSKDERGLVDEALRVVAWILMVLAFYQHMRLGDERPASALVNQNIYAGAVLMLLPLAVEKRDWLLAGGLLINLCWARSVGAWLGLSAALLITRRWRGGAGAWLGATGGLLCLILIYNKFQSPEVLNRLSWWGAALEMIYDRPWTGFGPGSFAFVLPAYREGGGLSTLYAHQHFLQLGAEFGLPFALLWCAGLWSLLMRGRTSHKRFAALAALLHAAWDWTLSMPANLWLFSYLAASSLTEESRGINIRSRWKLPAAAAILAAGVLACRSSWDLWAADRARSAADAALAAGRLDEARSLARASLNLVDGHPEAHLLLAAAGIQEAAESGRPGPPLEAAARELERAAELNPYRAATWRRLEAARDKLGQPELARAALERGARFNARLRR